jgi:hypothetical protein
MVSAHKILHHVKLTKEQGLLLGSTPIRKYYLVNWKSICCAKEFWGWGILNLEQKNCALLYKWG